MLANKDTVRNMNTQVEIIKKLFKYIDEKLTRNNTLLYVSSGSLTQP